MKYIFSVYGNSIANKKIDLMKFFVKKFAFEIDFRNVGEYFLNYCRWFFDEFVCFFVFVVNLLFSASI